MDANLELETRGEGHFLYDEIFNEWNICILFEPEVDVGDNSNIVDFDAPKLDEVAYTMTASSTGSTPAWPAIINILHLPVNHNELGRGIHYGHEIHKDIIFFNSFEDVLYS